MKVKSKEKVNIWAFEPYRRSNNLKGVLNQGFEIDVEEVIGEYVEEGEGVSKIASDKWFKDKNGDFYWSGGFERDRDINTDPDVNVIQLDTEVVDYQSIFQNLLSEVVTNECSNVTVALIDSGVDFSIASIKNNEIGESSSFDGTSPVDVYGHGTFIAGLISSIGTGNDIKGLAPQAKIFNCKITSNGKTQREIFLKALSHVEANSEKIDILNLSLSIELNINEQSEKLFFDEKLDPLLKSIRDKGVVIFAAAGNDDTITLGGILFPAYSENVISIGTLEMESFHLNEDTRFNDHLNYVFPNHEFLSIRSDKFQIKSQNGMALLSNSSVFTGICSGLAACYLSKNEIPKSERFTKINEYLNSISKKLVAVQNPTYNQIYRI